MHVQLLVKNAHVEREEGNVWIAQKKQGAPKVKMHIHVHFK